MKQSNLENERNIAQALTTDYINHYQPKSINAGEVSLTPDQICEAYKKFFETVHSCGK